jgi:hypothetical protein
MNPNAPPPQLVMSPVLRPASEFEEELRHFEHQFRDRLAFARGDPARRFLSRAVTIPFRSVAAY